MTGHDDWSRDHGAAALRRHAPEVASTLDRLVALVPPIGDGSVVARAREVCGRTLSLPPLPAPPVTSAPANADGTTQVPLEFAEQFSADVSMIDDAMRGALASALGDRTGTFVQSLYVADWVPRVRAGLDALFEGADADWGIPIEWATEGEPWPLIQRTLVDVARLRELDPVTTEVVRLYQARQHNCRLCKSLRNRTALLAGGDEAVYAEIDDYRSGGLSPRHKAGLGLAEGLTWQPGHLDPQAIAAVREHFSPAEAVELVLDTMRNSCNKIAVSTGTDQANITDGVEIYDVNPDGSVDFGLALPG
ncbi:carboxymuconolactone decarboxylase family protein [Rhodococcus sp. TAF43]|uniref:carboxymuconolactone decarboxylase family protein n=1 Tax=unclassified Rhodococcus (in: high G+C Gram-positive bacteria) TaxID=192944 RepID=UPI001582AB00|nr:carboxymuconolactone decarboxylase family protein [Rhodococcus sp. W8901]QKT10688.1 carboxymuconolactone decarboxylase family protein [Rhodococcus sp. W8901]